MLKIKILLLLVLFLSLPSSLLAADYILIVNKNNPIDSLEQESVKKIFLGKKNFWDDGHKVEVFLQEKNDIHKEFVEDILKRSVRQFKMYWRRELYSGTGLPPQELSDDNAIKETIASNSRAIGYISANSLDDSVKHVKIVTSQLN